MAVLIKVGKAYINPEHIVAIDEYHGLVQTGVKMTLSVANGSVPYALIFSDDNATTDNVVKWLQNGERVVLNEVTANPEELR